MGQSRFNHPIFLNCNPLGRSPKNWKSRPCLNQTILTIKLTSQIYRHFLLSEFWPIKFTGTFYGYNFFPIKFTWKFLRLEKVIRQRKYTKGLYMSFDKFLLAVESRDLSQADKSIIWVFACPSWVMGSKISYLSLNNWGLNFLQNECFQSSQIYLLPEKLRKTQENLANFWIDQNNNFVKLPSVK